MRLGNSGKRIRFCDAPLLPVIVREIGVPVEEKQMRIEQFAVVAKDRHKYLHGYEVEQQPSVREDRLHRLQPVSHARRADRALILDVEAWDTDDELPLA